MTLTPTLDPAWVAATPMILPRVARTHADALGSDTRVARLAIVGTAGSGKSRLLHQLSSRLSAQGRDVSVLGPDSDCSLVPADHVLVVDDVHLRSPALLAALARRLADPASSLVVATRPWPLAPGLVDVVEELERAQPSVVLGHVTASDVTAHLDDTGRLLERRCIEEMLELTGHLSWLASEALAIHDDLSCDGRGHPEIVESLRELIAHRLDTMAPAARAAVITASLGGLAAAGEDEAANTGYAKGLLLRNGRPAPVVRDTVRAVVPVDLLVEHYASTLGLVGDAEIRQLVGGVRDPRLAAALLLDGDDVLPTDPRRAAELYASAAEAGADAAAVSRRRAQAAWALGDIDAAGSLIDDAVCDDDGLDAAAAEMAGAVWAARGDMHVSGAAFLAGSTRSPQSVAHATIAAAGAGDAVALDDLAQLPATPAVPSALVVSLALVSGGLRSSLTDTARNALGDLVRAAEMYSASGHAGPIPEVPAVLAALTAINLGELGVAESVLDDAVRAGHGGRWARNRLLLWQAWVAVQRERPADAETALRTVADAPLPLSPRDRLLADAVRVALVRRHGDAAALGPVWARARDSILRTTFDLYSLIPLAEFAVTAARLGDSGRVQSHLDDAFALLGRLGDPPLWAAQLHWAALHAAILHGDAGDLTPHARALLAAAPHSRLAESMARAGRIWTEALTGEIHVDQIEQAALALASVGLAWDGARLASFAAGRAGDRRVSGRLLACARQLHSRDRTPPPEESAVEEHPRPSGVGDVLTLREREVARLVLQGKTYAEIGTSIFISPRTAEHHIARIRRRLGATSRSDLMSKLRVVIDESADPDERLSSSA